jgi:hypothetical protein
MVLDESTMRALDRVGENSPDVAEVWRYPRSFSVDAVATETSSFAFDQRSAAGGVSSCRLCIEVAHRSDIGHKTRKVGSTKSARRHCRAGDAGLDEPVQFRIRRYTPKLSGAKTDTRYRVAIGAVTGDAVRVVEIESDFHFRLRVLRTDSWNGDRGK